MTKTVYRIMVQIQSKGIERTLPYDDISSIETAEQTAEGLNIMLGPLGYHHYVYPTEVDTKKKENTHAYHGREQ